MTSTKVLDSELYYQIRDDLWNNYPKARAAMEEAANNLPELPITASTVTIHRGLFVEKPLYANMDAERGGLGDRYSFMWRNGLFPTPAALAEPEWEIEQVKSTENSRKFDYVAKGEAAIRFHNEPRPLLGPNFPGKSRPKVALQRLYRMRKIASKFEIATPAILAAQAGFKQSTTADDFLKHMKPVLDAFETGAITTKFHAMTDLGFECIKPDMHAARTLGWFNQLKVKRPQPGANVNEKGFSEPLNYLKNNWNKCHVVSQAVTLARTLSLSKISPIFKGNACREVDIVLMQASLHNVILKHA